MIVDENGVPNDLKVVTSDDVVANQNFLATASKYRFKPGTLSYQPTAVPVNLEITVRTTREPKVRSLKSWSNERRAPWLEGAPFRLSATPGYP